MFVAAASPSLMFVAATPNSSQIPSQTPPPFHLPPSPRPPRPHQTLTLDLANLDFNGGEARLRVALYRNLDSSGSSPLLAEEAGENLDGDLKPKLKPLHWDKVRASSQRATVWDQLKSSSFQLNEDMIETLFVNNATNPPPKETRKKPVMPPFKKENRVLDLKKSQNIAILLRALNETILFFLFVIYALKFTNILPCFCSSVV